MLVKKSDLAKARERNQTISEYIRDNQIPVVEIPKTPPAGEHTRPGTTTDRASQEGETLRVELPFMRAKKSAGEEGGNSEDELALEEQHAT